MTRKSLTVVFAVATGQLVLAHTVVDDDFLAEPAGIWHCRGSCAISKEQGAVLVSAAPKETGTLTYGDPIPAQSLKVSLSFLFSGGSNGLVDGLAVGILGTPTPGCLGTGGGLFGLGNLPDCSSALVVEFDGVNNDSADFGPLGAGLFHAGVAYSSSGSIAGTTHLPTFAAKDLSALWTHQEEIHLNAEIHLHGNRITVCCGPSDGELARVLEEEIPDFVPFEGYLTLAAANGRSSGHIAVLSASVETEAPPPPVLAGRSAGRRVELTWSAPAGPYDQFVLLRDGKELQILPGEAHAFTDPSPSHGKHVYELLATRVGGGKALPAGTTVFHGAPFLVVDAITSGDKPTPNAQAWLDRLAASGRSCARTTAIDTCSLDQFAAVVWINGSGIVQPPIPTQASEKLRAYLEGSVRARLYMEGASLWSHALLGPLGAADGVQSTNEGWPATELQKRNGDLVGYHGLRRSLDELEPAPSELGAQYSAIWRRVNDPGAIGDERRVVGVCARADGGRIVLIATSVELHRIASETDRDAAFAEYMALLEQPSLAISFKRGDANGDGQLAISDPVFLLGYLFRRSAQPSCFDAGDSNDDGRLDLADAVNILGYLFARGELKPPGPACGPDPTADNLPSCVYEACP